MDAFKLMLVVAGLAVVISMLVAGVIHVLFAAIRHFHKPAGGESGQGS